MGSSNVITNQAGNLIGNYEYLPYGEFSERQSTSAPVTSYYFTGKELDDETGLMFYGARYYDPEIGRFITPDTIVQAPYDPQSLNRYSYCRNNPINLIDPTGHSFLDDVCDWVKDNVIDPIVNIGKAILSGDWKTIAIVAVSVAANILIPGSGTLASNFLLNVGLHVLRGAAIGALTGGISSEIMGGSFWEGAKIGAIAGAITGAVKGVTTSQQFQNWRAGNGFRSDSVVEAEQAKAASSQATLAGARGSDEAMENVMKTPQQPAETGVKDSLSTDLDTKGFFESETEERRKGRYIIEQMYKNSRRDCTPWDPPTHLREMQGPKDIVYMWFIENGLF